MKIKNLIIGAALVVACLGGAFYSANASAHSDAFYHTHEQPSVFLGCKGESVQGFTRSKSPWLWVNVCRMEKVSALRYSDISIALRSLYPGLRPRIEVVEPGEVYDIRAIYLNGLKRWRFIRVPVEPSQPKVSPPTGQALSTKDLNKF